MLSMIKDDGELKLVQDFIETEEALDIHNRLLKELDWHEEYLQIYGKSVKVPRLMCWYGDPSAVYTYSGVTHTPQGWTDILQQLKQRLEKYTGKEFNSMLANLYRNGNDSMGWHADKENELGAAPFIASLSFGNQRAFKIRHNKTKETLTINLANGSLLLMGGTIQKHWRHSVPKTKQMQNTRINLTFRKILNCL